MEPAQKFIIPGIVLLLTLVSGLWLSNAGKPLNTAIFTLHKLIALGSVILAAIQFFNILKNSEVHAIVIALIGLAGLAVLALFASGALMSIGKANYSLVLIVHRIAPVIMIAAAAVSILLLSGRTS
jgi:hypothetical protein